MTTAELTWEQVHRWRLAQHRLSGQAAGESALEIVRAICGLQAQLMSAAELALRVRSPDASPSDLEAGLWRDRTLVKTWVMRGTLHIVAADDLPLYVAARAATPVRRPPSYFTYHGVTPEEYEQILAAVPAVLSDTPQTREQLADAVAERAANPRLRTVLLSGWGALLKPSAWSGALCFGPGQGQNVTFVHPRRWLHGWREFEPQEALREVARRFLAAYGPATPEDFARWWGTDPGPAKRLFRSLEGELAQVDVEGWRAWALAATLEAMADPPAGGGARLLPAFDPYTIALLRHPAVLPEERRSQVSRPQGWIAPAILLGGRIVGVWEHEAKGRRVNVRLEPFEPPPPEASAQLEREAQRLSAFLEQPQARRVEGGDS
ncbi:MAG: winged helix DNA-binding domain-containing protein [Chloroflexota bacterium]